MKILIFSSSKSLARPMARVFEQSGHWAEACHSAEHLLSMSMTENYAAVIVMSDQGPAALIDLFSRWKEQGCTSLFVVVSSSQSGFSRAKVLEAGVDRYLIAPYSYTALVNDIALSQFRSGMPEREQYVTASFRLDLLGRMVYCSERLLVLSKIEFELLSLLIRRRGIVLSRVQIWEEIWGYREYGEANTIDVHINRLRNKLPKEARHLIRTVYGIGYRMHESA